MPITVTTSVGRLTPRGEDEILPALTDALLEVTGATDNPFLRSIVGGTVQLLDPRRLYRGGVHGSLVLVELKLPPVALSDIETRTAFIAAATDVVDALTVDDHRRDDTWVNILHAPDGGWGIGGRAYTGEQLLAAAGGA
jgi:hypothetical protein